MGWSGWFRRVVGVVGRFGGFGRRVVAVFRRVGFGVWLVGYGAGGLFLGFSRAAVGLGGFGGWFGRWVPRAIELVGVVCGGRCG